MGLPEKGDVVRIFWPGGPHDFAIIFSRAEPMTAPGYDGWMYMYGFVVEPSAPKYRTNRGFYVHPVDGGYALTPHR